MGQASRGSAEDNHFASSTWLRCIWLRELPAHSTNERSCLWPVLPLDVRCTASGIAASFVRRRQHLRNGRVVRVRSGLYFRMLRAEQTVRPSFLAGPEYVPSKPDSCVTKCHHGISVDGASPALDNLPQAQCVPMMELELANATAISSVCIANVVGRTRAYEFTDQGFASIPVSKHSPSICIRNKGLESREAPSEQPLGGTTHSLLSRPW